MAQLDIQRAFGTFAAGGLPIALASAWGFFCMQA